MSTRDTPWGPLEVRDAHVHFFSHRFFSMIASQVGGGLTADSIVERLGWQRPDPDPAQLAVEWAAELDRQHIAQAALIASLPGDEDSLIAALAACPDRFYGYFMADPTAPDAAARVQSVLEAGLQGVCLFPAMHRYSLHDERVLPVLQQAASARNALVFVHCGVLTVGIRRKLGLTSRFDLRFSNPVDVHALALQFPNLPFVIPHFGAGYLREALMVADLCPNVYLDTSSSNDWVKYQSPPLSVIDVFRQALNVLGPRRLLFGTDSSFFPRGWNEAIFRAQSDALKQLGVSRDEASLIFGGNLQRLLHR